MRSGLMGVGASSRVTQPLLLRCASATDLRDACGFVSDRSSGV